MGGGKTISIVISIWHEYSFMSTITVSLGKGQKTVFIGPETVNETLLMDGTLSRYRPTNTNFGTVVRARPTPFPLISRRQLARTNEKHSRGARKLEQLQIPQISNVDCFWFNTYHHDAGMVFLASHYPCHQQQLLSLSKVSTTQEMSCSLVTTRSPIHPRGKWVITCEKGD